MRTTQDFRVYQESLQRELEGSQNRVRQLIGSAHWLTDGEHKEELLRVILRRHLPLSYQVGTGFVCFPGNSSRQASSQIDILITSKESSALYREGYLSFVTSEAAKAIIEVKTELRSSRGDGGITGVLTKLANDAQEIRRRSRADHPLWVGLFVFEAGRLNPNSVLKALQVASGGSRERVVDFVCVGSNLFCRFWDAPDSPNEMPMWCAYQLVNLSPAYFVNNLVFELSAPIGDDDRRAWFPEQKKTICSIGLSGG